MSTHYQGTARERRALDAFIKLQRAASTVGARLYAPLAREHGLTESQLGVLEAILHLGPLSQGQLCEKLLRSGSNLTTVVDNLERAGLVRRERAAEDRRVQIVDLTATGRELIGRVFPRHVQNVAELMAALTGEEQEQLARLCRKLGLATRRT
ncbi:MAG TPA: MarR family winged helix-turn-helix transcriptional regulator [Gemmatimonadaceae bacterium]|nr:MarR family winged helix-turn-helix transcriptional regulator [Gemmatimonadaceae bacterium]